MFKLGVILFCAILYTTRGVERENKIMIYMNPDLVSDFRKSAAVCGKEYGVDPREIRKIMNGTLGDDIVHRQFLFCTLNKSEYVDDGGMLRIDKAMRLTPLNGTVEEVTNIYEGCNDHTETDVLEIISKMELCYHHNVIVILKRPDA